ncbi:MAG: leucine-rich repeat domain-containing protein, partial [Anaerolineales bacterium]
MIDSKWQSPFCYHEFGQVSPIWRIESGAAVGTHNHAVGLKKTLFRLWAGLCLGGMLLGLALAPASSPQVASAAPDDFDCGEVTEIPRAECEALVAIFESTDGPNWSILPEYDPWLSTNTPCSWYGVGCEAGSVVGIDLSDFCARQYCENSVGLSGMIPPQIGDLSRLEILNLTFNYITGNIPPEIGNLTNLVCLQLSANELSGGIPSEIGNLTELRNLALSGNYLTGNIPQEIGNLANLETLYIFENQ